jgi:hypothetical protein
MHRLLSIGALAIVVGLGAAEANAANLNPNVPSWSPYAMMGYSGAASEMTPPPLTEGRSAYTLHNPEGPLNDYYRKSGLSDRREDCATYGCATSNGG